MKLYFCHLRLCAKFQNPKNNPFCEKSMWNRNIRGSLLPSLYMLAPSLSGKVKYTTQPTANTIWNNFVVVVLLSVKKPPHHTGTQYKLAVLNNLGHICLACNLILTQLEQILKMTSMFSKWKATLIFLKLKTTLFFKDGRVPHIK